MRNRNPKNLEQRIRNHDHFVVDEITLNRDRNTYVEIGSGKGIFLSTLAVRNTGDDFVGIEGQQGALLRCLEKAEALCLDNVRYYPRFIKNIRDHFEPDSLSGIYLNFSDPWPKDRHAKRRLTNRKFQKGYHEVLKDGAFIEFKTDNDILFDYSLIEFNEAPFFEITEMTRDLHSSEYVDGNVMTEYEDKFSMRGKNINYLKAAKVK